MAFKLALVLCALVAQAIGAPKPCVSGCYSTTGGSSSSTSYEAMSAFQTHGNLLAQQSAAFQQLHQNLLNSLHQQTSKYDFSRPGSWSSPNAYRTPDGGQVYEEHGKIQHDNGQTQYFKQNYTNSWSSGNADVEAVNNNLVQGTHNGGFSGSIHNEQHLNWQGTAGQHQRPQKIEDFSTTQVDSQASQATYENIMQMVRNLNSYISQCTERVQQGTLSNYESYINVVQQHLDRMRQDIREHGLYDRLIAQVNSIETHLAELRRTAEYSSRVVQAPVVHVQPNYHVSVEGQQSSQINVHGSVPRPVIPSGNLVHQGQHLGAVEVHQGYVSTPDPNSIRGSLDDDNSDFRSTGGFGHALESHGGASSSTWGSAQQTGQTWGSSTQGAGWGSTHGSTHGNVQDAGWGSTHGGSAWGATHGQINTVQQPVKTVHDEWHASGSHKETVYHPQITSGSYTAGGGCSGSWCPTNGGQTEVSHGCYGRAYGTLCKRYKRDYRDFSQQTEDLTQQTEDLTQQTEDLTQQTEDLTQQTEDLTQQTEDLTQQTEDLTQQTQDLTQQHVGNLQRGSQYNQGGYRQTGSEVTDFTQQQQTGGLEFGNQQPSRQHEHHGHNDGDRYNQGFGRHHGHEQHGHNDGDSYHSGSGRNHEQHGHNDGDSYHPGSGHHHDHGHHGHNQGYGDYSQQQSSNLELGSTQQHQHHHEHDDDRHRQHVHHPDHEHHHRHTHNEHSQVVYTQQTQGFGDFSQQQGRGQHGGYTQQTQGFDQSGFSQQTQDLSQQTQGFEDLTQQQTIGHHGRRPAGGLEIGDLNGSSQQNDYHRGYTQQTEDLTQQTQGFEDLTQQQSFGSLQSGSLHQQVQKPDHFGGFTQQTQDLTQQTQGFEDLTQQQSFGNLQSGSLHQQVQKPDHFGGFTQQTQDLTQQTQGFEDLTQQQSFGNLQSGNLHQQIQKNDHFGGYTQQTQDLTQQTQGFEDLVQQQTVGQLQLGQQPQNHDFGYSNQQGWNQQVQDFSQQTQSFGGLTQQPQGNFGQSQFGQQHQPGFGELNSQTPAPKPPARNQFGRTGDTEPIQPIPGVKGGKRRQPIQELPQEWHKNHHSGDLTSENFQQRVNDNSESTTNQPTNSTDPNVLFQPRIIEAYGGKGPYDIHHSNKIFEGVKPNPTATLAPLVDAWNIREKPNDFYPRSINQPSFAGASAQPAAQTVTSEWAEYTTTTPAPGFFKRVGNKIASTYEKAKEKISGAFG
uniref:Uncharacterized protein n=1 Tax=Bracon brevicornis TaxID=1563983 RepID=A0A6V7KUP3_9HYME